MSCLDKKFWTENFGALFSSIQVVPLHNMNLAQQLNAITRTVLIIFIIMLLFDFKYAIHFLIISVSFIIIIYYIQRNTMSKCRENYTNYIYNGPSQYVHSSQLGNPIQSNTQTKIVNENGQKYIQATINTPEKLPFCNDQVDYLSDFAVGMNQSLAGGTGKFKQNPKTLISPVVKPPSHDLSYWRDNNLVTHSAINTESVQQDMYASGYAESTCCGYLGDGAELVPQTTEGYQHDQIFSPRPTTDTVFVPTLKEGYQHDQIFSPRPTTDTVFVPTLEEGYEQPYRILPSGSGQVNTMCGYNPDQLFTAGLPTNLPSGNCEQNPVFKQYNQNLHTQTVTPGVYTRTQINEPINSNIGISFQQQFEPLTCNRNEKGLMYTQHDPRIIEPASLERPVQEKPVPNYDNVYDPRFYGYGTSYRSYIDDVTGQPRFAYDDVNAIRMPNYITRSKIDHLAYADKYGPMEQGAEYGNKFNPSIRALAQDSWMRDSLQFRNDITERRMRKINAEKWQQRQYPLRS